VLLAIIGDSGVKAISKLTSIVLSAYGIMMVRRGIADIIMFYVR
jgi:small neutral amino acid transporter SnatA (MarC family)